MNEEEMIAILNANVGDVCAKLDEISEASDLQALLDAENAADKPRKGVIEKLHVLLKLDDAPIAETPKTSTKEIKAEIEKLEALPLCVRTAGRLDALRNLLEDLQK